MNARAQRSRRGSRCRRRRRRRPHRLRPPLPGRSSSAWTLDRPPGAPDASVQQAEGLVEMMLPAQEMEVLDLGESACRRVAVTELLDVIALGGPGDRTGATRHCASGGPSKAQMLQHRLRRLIAIGGKRQEGAARGIRQDRCHTGSPPASSRAISAGIGWQPSTMPGGASDAPRSVITGTVTFTLNLGAGIVTPSTSSSAPIRSIDRRVSSPVVRPVRATSPSASHGIASPSLSALRCATWIARAASSSSFQRARISGMHRAG